MVVVHLVTPEVWAQAAQSGVYAPSSLETEGFIHCSFPEQSQRTARRYYADVPRLLAVVFDGHVFGDDLVVEDTSGHGEFPHVYRAIDPAMAARVVELTRDEDGWVTAVI